MRLKKKFYVASPAMNPLGKNGRNYETWGKETLDEAIEHAKKLCEDTGEPQIVVQVVRVVRQKKPPMIISKV